jgi:hypothetical protein
LLLLVSTQLPPQLVWFAAQPQTPATQLKPAPQALPHMPQFSGSVWNEAASTQPVPHCMSPAGHIATHAELEHRGVAAGQALPQSPQLAPSAAVFAHAWPQALSGAAQAQAALTQVCIGPQAVAH